MLGQRSTRRAVRMAASRACKGVLSADLVQRSADEYRDPVQSHIGIKRFGSLVSPLLTVSRARTYDTHHACRFRCRHSRPLRLHAAAG
ncbi:hypothetical protein XAP6164_4810023 [Xanthomonas phaseoli pv. phaseoli]|nr:hypothetical protein XAP6164_4810023 [Xanthomonas phaseoli pv. phaseoli]